MKVIKRADTEDMSGLMDAFMKEISHRMLSNLFFILGMVKVGLFILMDDKLKVFGNKVLYLKLSLKIQNNISSKQFLKNQKILKSNERFEY